MDYISKDDNFQWDGIEYGYNGSNSCESYGCNEEGICRCFSIEETWVEAVDVKKIAERILPSDASDLAKYALERVLIANGILNPDNWNIVVSGDYYGDEIRGIYYSYPEELNLKLNNFFELETDDKKINFALREEYGKEPFLKMTYSIVDVDLDSIEITNQKHFEECEDDKFYDDRKRMYWKPALDECGLCLVRGTERKSVLVDGYHRLASFKKSDIKTAKVVLGTEIK